MDTSSVATAAQTIQSRIQDLGNRGLPGAGVSIAAIALANSLVRTCCASGWSRRKARSPWLKLSRDRWWRMPEPGL